MQINDYEASHSITDEDFKTPSDDKNFTSTGSGTTGATNTDVVSTLNNLIETCKDGQEGFQQAAEGVQRSDLKSFFYECSQQRAQFAGELQSLVRELGGEPETTSSTLGSLHRGWINLKSAITGQDDNAILNECERGEDSAKDNYKAALESNLPANVSDIVQRQYEAVKTAHDQVKTLRNVTSDTGTSSNTATGH